MNQETINLGKSAQELMDSEIYRRVVESLKKDAYGAWLETTTDAVQVREDLYFMQKALRHIETRLIAYVDNGRIEQVKAEQVSTVNR